jgi:hypothetical protein
LSASIASAQAGSATIPSSLKSSSIVVETLHSGLTSTWIHSFLHISWVIVPTFATLAPSIKVEVSSIVSAPQFQRAYDIEGAHSGSTHMMVVFFLNAFFAWMIHEISPPHHIGAMM